MHNQGSFTRTHLLRLLSPPPRATRRPYQIHLVKSQNPAYIPSDLEAWPIYYEAIQEALANYPDAHDAAIEAIRETRKQFTGLENLDVPPAPCPSRDRVMQSLSWRQIWQRDRPGGRSYFRGAG